MKPASFPTMSKAEQSSETNMATQQVLLIIHVLLIRKETNTNSLDGDTGILVDNAMSLIKPPAWSEKQMLEFYYTAVKEALSYGLTSIHDAGSTEQYINFFKKCVRDIFCAKKYGADVA